MYSLALYILRDQHDAQDITQEVFTKLWHSAAQPPAEQVKLWLLTVTRNACIDKIRKEKKQLPIEDNHKLASKYQEPAGHFEQKQLSTWLERTIVSLKEPYSTLILLCDVHQQQHDVVAQSLDLTRNQVKVYLHRARRQLKSLLQEHCYDE